jgi:hypothetical protein
MNKQDAGRSPAVKVVSPTPAMDINRGPDTRGDVRARDAATTHGACAFVEWEPGRFPERTLVLSGRSGIGDYFGK